MVSLKVYKGRASHPSKRKTKLRVVSRERAVSIPLIRLAPQKKETDTQKSEVRAPAAFPMPIGARVTWVHRVLSLFSIFALVGPMLVPAITFASPGYLMGSVNPQITGALQLSISGSASANPYVGSGMGQQFVSIDWGDGVRDEFPLDGSDSRFTTTSTSKPNTFNTSWTPISHLYTFAGVKTIVVKVHHQSWNGNGEGDGSEFTVDVFIPPAALNVIKHVINSGGGTKIASEFTLYVSGTNVTPTSFSGSELGTIVSLDAGTYNVSEDSIVNYTGSFSLDCSGTIASGETKTCIITNTFSSSPPPPPPVPQCSDGADNDGDGKIDFPADPGCSSSSDDDETDAPPPPPPTFQCSDGLDNDSDGKIDYPDDPGCSGASDDDETDPAPPPDPEDDLTECSNEADDDSDGLVDLDDPGCAEFAPKITVMKILTNDNTGTAVVSDFSFFVDLFEVFLGIPTVFSPGPHTVSETGPGGYTAAFGGDCGSGGSVSLEIGESATCTITNDDIDYPQCSDGIDNDDDGDIDEDDLGCSSPEDDDESDDPVLPQCSDGVDNDGDGDVDGADSGCSSADDNSENTPPVITIETELVELTLHSSFNSLSGVTVADVEDDPDPSIVVGGDVVNTSATGTYVVTYDATDSHGAAAEQKMRTVNVVSPECSNGIDDDGDGKIDYPADPACSSANDNDESDDPLPPPPSPQCSDGTDNDQDGLIDMNDPGCADSSDNDETNTTGGGDSGGGDSGSGSSGSSGGGGNGPILSLAGDNTSGGGGGGGIVLPSGLVLGAAAEDNLPEGCTAYLDVYIKLGAKNDPEKVKKLQAFLNTEMGANLPITGFYGPLSYAWVEKFQVKYWEEILKPWVPHGLPTDHTPTGYVYKTTRRWINMLNCPELNLPIPPLP